MELSSEVKKMLEGLPVSPTTITELASYMAKIGVYVDVHIKRCRGSIALPPRAVGVRTDRMSAETKDAYDSIVRLGVLRFVPQEDERKLYAIETAMRRSLSDYTTVDGFMPTALFPSYTEKFNQLHDEYMAQRDAIVDKWDELVNDFSARVRTMLAGIRMLQRDRVRLHETIMKSLPSKAYYRDSFACYTSTRSIAAQPYGDDVDLPDDVRRAVQNTWEQATVSMVEQSVVMMLAEVFDAINNAVRSYMETGRIHGRTLNSLAAHGERLSRLNVFHNPEIASVSTLLRHAPDQDLVTMEAELEQCLISIYRYTDSVGYELGVENCVFDRAALAAAA